MGFCQIIVSYEYCDNDLLLGRRKICQIADVLVNMHKVGICALPACADVTRRQHERERKEHRLKRSRQPN